MTDIVPEANRIFNYEYVQLHSVAQNGDSRVFHAEGPIVIGTPPGAGRVPGELVMHIGMPENMITWAITKDLPTLKVEKTAFMAAVPYSARFYIIEFLAEAPKEVIAAFEKALAQHTSYAVSDASSELPASMLPADAHVSAQSGTAFSTTPETASKIRGAGAACASTVATIGDHVGLGLVKVGEWYRRRSEGKQAEVAISDSTKARVEGAKHMTSKVAGMTTSAANIVGGLIGGAAAATVSTAQKAGIGKEGTRTHGAACTVKEGVCALVEVFDAMHDAGRHVITTGADQTATSVEYRYGKEAGGVTQTGMGVAVDAYDVYGAYRSMRATALARAFVKDAAGASRPAQPPVAPPSKVDGGPGGEALSQRGVAEEDVELVEPLVQPTYHSA